MQEIHDDHLRCILDEHDEMLPRPYEPQVFRQIRIDQLTAALGYSRPIRNLPAPGNQILLVGRSLSGTKGFNGPKCDLDKRRFRLSR